MRALTLKMLSSTKVTVHNPAMDTELLRTFLEVKATRHFGHAADNLYITQAAVSARIKQLEIYFGAPLFVRDRHNIQLTPQGEQLVPHAEAILMSILTARQDVALREGAGLRLSIAIRDGLWGSALEHRFKQLRHDRSDLNLQIQSVASDTINKQLRDRSLDAAVVFGSSSAPEWESVPIGELTLKLFASYGITSLDEALASQYVYLDWGGGFARFHVRHVAKQWMPSLQTNSITVAVSAIQEAAGACFLPQSWTEALLAQGIQLVPDAPQFSSPIHLLCHQQTRQAELVALLSRSLANLSI